MSLDIEKRALRALSLAFDNFIDACLNDDGKAQAPTNVDIAKARAYLPPYCKHAYSKKKKKGE